MKPTASVILAVGEWFFDESGMQSKQLLPMAAFHVA